MLDEVLPRLINGESLTQDEMVLVVQTMVSGQADEVHMAALLTALRMKGESVDEIAGAAQALRKHMTPIQTKQPVFIDTCGTGGDGLGTFNISTAAAIVTAAAGLPVAKHGNRAVTSRTGSADVLAALGVNIEADQPTVERCLKELGLCFCFAPLFHGAMRHVGPVRRRLPFRTLFNVLGPLANPAGAPFQLIGVGQPALRPKLAAALLHLGTRRAAVVCGLDGLDEVSLSGPTHVSLAENGKVTELVWTPTDFGLPFSPVDALLADGPQASAHIIRQLLAGTAGAARDIVLANSAAALWLAGLADTLPSGVALAAAAIDSQAAAQLLERLARSTQPAAPST